jgi:hypothetical protein
MTSPLEAALLVALLALPLHLLVQWQIGLLSDPDWIGERELYLEPGLVYVTD